MEIDLLSPASFDGGQPHDQFDWLRANAPFYRHHEPGGAGFYAVTRYDDVRAISRNAGDFSSEPSILIPDPEPGSLLSESAGQMMLTMDPPKHTAFRKLVSDAFKPQPARGMRPRIAELATQIVDEVIERGECEFVSEVAGELPSYVIAELMGLPLEDGRKLYEYTEQVHAAPETLPEGAQMRAAQALTDYGLRVAQEKRSHPGSDLASRLLAAEVDGRKLTDPEFQLFFALLVDAGGDTTRNLVGGALLTLLQNPGELDRLRREPEAWPAAREELLRWQSPVVYMRRTATRDVVFHDTQLKAGDKVVLYYGAANRDPGAFDSAGRLDLGRDPNPHVAFGYGTHFCLGSHVARIEIDALFDEILRRMHDIELDGEVAWLASNFISGPTRIPVRFRPGPKMDRERP